MFKGNNKLLVLVKPYVVWMVLIVLYFAIGARISWKNAITPALLFIAAQYIIFTLNRKRLIPNYFEAHRSKFYNYNLLLILLISVLLLILIEISFKLIPAPSPPEHRNPIIFPLFLHISICLIATWASVFTYLIDKEKETKIEIDNLKREKAESELKFLKTQINPHFLFNALNNIYSMAYSGDKMVPEKIAILSDMLRYVLYDCESDYIPLDMEIEYIKSFVEFQQLKTKEKQKITFTISDGVQNKQIAPMLLAPLVENGFKHSCIEKDRSGFVEIIFTVEKDKLVFNVRNSIPKGLKPSSKINGEKGIGIENIKNRLKLLYPKKHNLIIEKDTKMHSVTLELY